MTDGTAAASVGLSAQPRYGSEGPSAVKTVMQQMSNAPGPSERERTAFVARLAEFRDRLPASERQMLDALVGAAIAGRAPEDLARYWISLRVQPVDAADSTAAEAT
jgi:hypothetical protein